MLVPSTGQIKNRRGCRGPQHGVLWQDCPVEIDGLSPLQKREHSQGPLPNPSQHSGPRFPSLAPSPCTLLLICGICWLCAGAFNPQQENRWCSETTGFPNHFSETLKALLASSLYCCGADQISGLVHHLLNQLLAKTSSAKAGSKEQPMKHRSDKSYLIWPAIQCWGCY